MTRRIIAFIVFYVTIILAILFTYFYIQERYGHNATLEKTESGAKFFQFTAGKISPGSKVI